MELSPEFSPTTPKKLSQIGRVFQLVIDALQRINILANENGASVLVILQRSKEEVYLPLLGESFPDRAAPLRERSKSVASHT